jgi:hypothetical protein
MERKIGDIKDKKLKAENITLAAIYNILFTNDIVCSLIVEMLSALRKSELCRFRVKQQGNKLEQLMLQYEKKINKIAGHRAFGIWWNDESFSTKERMLDYARKLEKAGHIVFNYL